jgi:hypothetical protein
VSHNPPPWYLTIRKGPKAGSAYALPAGTITIGRHADNQIVIDDPMVSRHHARLTWQGNTFLLEDLGSANGVWVNNRRITNPTPLRHGDVVGLSQAVLLLFSDRPQADATMVEASASSEPAPAAMLPSSPPATPAAGKGRGWLVFGLGGMMAILAVVALALVGLAIYLLLRKPTEAPELQVAMPAATPISTAMPIPTATPYPTYTPVPTEMPTATPYPTYTPFATEIPTATPYPTYTPYPTEIPTATPYPTYTPYPTATTGPNAPQQPTHTPLPTISLLPPYSVTLGRNIVYEPWGRPVNPDGCNGPYNDESPVRRFTVEVILSNNSDRFIPDHWTPVFVSASGRPLPTCIWYYNNTTVQPDEIINVTFATHLESDDWVKALVFDELGYTLTVCLSPSGQMVSCQ